MRGQRGKKVLILDDSDISAHFQTTLLTLHGFAVRNVSSPRDFARLIDSWAPDLVLIDVRMPEVDGTELCRQLKAAPHTARIPVVLFSGLPRPELELLAARCGADACLSKSSDFENFGEKIASLCAGM
jgi:CheY-like chemotaxis protein